MSMENEEIKDVSLIPGMEEVQDASAIDFGEDTAGEKIPETAAAEKKKVRPARIAYLVFVLLLIAAMAWGLVWIWNACSEYQKNSAATLVGEAGRQLSEETGLELESSLIPAVSEEGYYEYVLKSEGKPVAKVTLNKVKSGIMGLALFETKEVSSLVHYKVVMPDDCVLDVRNQNIDYMSAAED